MKWNMTCDQNLERVGSVSLSSRSHHPHTLFLCVLFKHTHDFFQILFPLLLDKAPPHPAPFVYPALSLYPSTHLTTDTHTHTQRPKEQKHTQKKIKKKGGERRKTPTAPTHNYTCHRARAERDGGRRRDALPPAGG